MNFERYIEFILSHSKVVVALTVALALVAAAGTARLTITNDMRAYFSADNPQLQAFEALEATFDKQDNVLVLVTVREGDLFTPERLNLIRELTALGWQVPYSRRVDSLANFQHVTATGDDIQVANLIPSTGTLNTAKSRQIREVALATPELINRTVANDGMASGILIALSLPDNDPEANDGPVRFLRAALPRLRAMHPDVTMLIGGTTATNVALGEAVQRDLQALVIISYAVVVFGLLLLLRHFTGTAATVTLASLTVAATMGVAGWAGMVLEAVSGFVPSVVITVAVADAIHILTSFYYELRRGSDQETAVRQAMRVNGSPILITSLTTMIGVLSLNFSDSPPYHDLGNLIALGVAIAYLLSMSFLPAALSLFPVRAPQRGARLEAAMSRFADSVVRCRRGLLAITGTTCLVVASFIPMNIVTERWYEYFDDSFEIRNTVDALNQHFGGLHTIRYALRAPSPGEANSPEFIADVERFVAWLRRHPEVSHASGISDVLKRLNQSLHDGDPTFRRLPDSAALTAQLLLLYELSLPFGLGLETLIDMERSASQVLVVARQRDSEQLIALDEEFRDFARSYLQTARLDPGAGVDMMFAHINRRNTRALLTGMVVALVLISLLLVFALRSVTLGGLSLITNLAPAALAYGTWGITVGWIDLSASVVICMSIGIVVDDTVHFLSKYQWARRREGLNVGDSLRFAFNTVGVALCITTAVLVAGFLVLTASSFSPTVTTGLLMSITLSFALVVDFLLLPPLLLSLTRNRLS